VSLIRPVRPLLSVAVLLRRFVRSRWPRNAQRRRQEQLEQEVREFHMGVMGGGRWAAVGNNRLTNFWRVVLHISDAIFAGEARARLRANSTAVTKTAVYERLNQWPHNAWSHLPASVAAWNGRG
jgi:hypothetical protein